MRRTVAFPLLLLTLSLASLALAPASVGQAPPVSTELLYGFDLQPEPGIHLATVGAWTVAHLTFTDTSHDSAAGFVSGQSGGVIPHYVSFRVIPGLDEHGGWTPSSMGQLVSFPGNTYTVDLQVRVDPVAKNPYYVARVNATIQTTRDTFYREAELTFFTRGIPGFTLLPGPAIDGLHPVEIQQASLQVYNVGVLRRTYEFNVGDNACNLGVVPPTPLVVPPRAFGRVEFSIRGPDSRFNPLGDDNCVVTLKVDAVDNPEQVLSVAVPVKVTGQYFDPLAVFYVLAAIVLLVLLILFLRRRKERLEEEILGKPQKPWTIPVEQVYLRHLKAKDSRAWYVVRHYLMEDEYRSSLLWYKAYKKATRGDRKKERLVLVQEKSYARWKAGWDKDIAKPARKADRFEAKLQRKLDRKARKAHRKARRKWRKAVKKAEAKHAKLVEKEQARQAKLVARARKKGLPEPEPVEVPAPALPPEPTLQARPLSGHRWAKKAARFRRRMARRQGNLEVKFEKADARKQAKLQRKVRKLTRGMQDSEFVAQHGAQQ